MSVKRFLFNNRLLFSILIILLHFLSACKESSTDNILKEQDNRKGQGAIETQYGFLTKEEILSIAKDEVNRVFKDSDKLHAYFDVNNEQWKDTILDPDPNLMNHEFQAILFTRKRSLPPQPIGEIWICVDKKTGQILARYGH